MTVTKLGVNIDHVATVRNARGEDYPSPLRAAKIMEKSGVDSVTIHLREDRRHIKDTDLILIKKNLRIPLNLEIAPTNKMINISLKYRPDYVCIVPEKRKEITTEGGLNLKKKYKVIKKHLKRLKQKKIRTSLFIEPNLDDIKIAREINTDCIEIHTGKFCKMVNENRKFSNELKRINKAVKFANNLGLEVHAGHGITFASAKILSKIKGIQEFNIGHFIIGEAIFIGIKDTVKIFRKILK